MTRRPKSKWLMIPIKYHLITNIAYEHTWEKEKIYQDTKKMDKLFPLINQQRELTY